MQRLTCMNIKLNVANTAVAIQFKNISHDLA